MQNFLAESAEFIPDSPDVWRWGPHLYGLLNEPLVDAEATGGPIVLSFSYRYKPGKEYAVDLALNRLTQYYALKNEFGTLLQNYQLTAFNGGYSFVQVFSDARAFEIHMNNTDAYPNQGEILELASNVELIGSYLVGLPAEIEKAPSIAELYPDILIIQGTPVLKPYGDIPVYGWVIASFENGFNKLFVVLPLLDIFAGIWNADTWTATSSDW